MGVKNGALSLALLLGGVNAACMDLAPPPRPLPTAATAGAPAQVWAGRAGRRLTGEVTLRDGKLYGPVDRKVYAVDLTSGRSTGPSGSPASSRAACSSPGTRCFAASSRPDGRVHALDRTTGEAHLAARARHVGAPLALSGGVLLVPTQRGDLLGIGSGKWRVRWRRRLGISGSRRWRWRGRRVIIATVDSLVLPARPRTAR